MEQITITKSNASTIISVTDTENLSSARKIATSNSELFKTSEGTQKIMFPNCCELNELNINAARLSNATRTALGINSNSTILEVFDAMVANRFFEGN